MIIHQPEITQLNDHTIVSARVEMHKPVEKLPQILWFRVPDRYAAYISTNSDAFLIPGLLAGMRLQEDIEVRGKVSPKLAYHLEEYQALLHHRMPGVVRPVQIKYDQLLPLQAQPQAAGTTFSGGVDSFFTLWKHTPLAQPLKQYQISHALFILGFDILNKDSETYTAFFEHFHRALREIHVELVPLETNLVSVIISRMKYLHFYSPLLASAVHALGGLFKTFLIPGSYAYSQKANWEGTADGYAVPLLSTDTSSIKEHGSTHTRAGKIKAISDWPVVHQNLRVCTYSSAQDDKFNCSRCEKCARTMIPIYALGKMDQFITFRHPFKKDYEVLWWARKFKPYLPFFEETISLIIKHRPKMLPWLLLALLLGTLRYGLLKLIPGRLRTWLNRFGYFVDPFLEENAFDDPVLIEHLSSIRSGQGDGLTKAR